MHAVQLVDLAAVISLHGPALLYQPALISPEAAQTYWITNRGRFDAWHRQLGMHHQSQFSGDQKQLVQWWKDNQGLLDEILLSEPLVRVYAALAASLDRSFRTDEIAPTTHSVYDSHLEVRRRVLQIIANDCSGAIEEAVRLNRLRVSIERWSDTLLGYLMIEVGDAVIPYAFEAGRVIAFADDARQMPQGVARETAGWLTSAAMRDALVRQTSGEIVSEQANRKVADAVLMCLRPDLFDSIGQLKSLWLHRLQKGAEQTDRVLDQLSRVDINSAPILGGYEMIRHSQFGRW